jgi:hypothetical protein
VSDAPRSQGDESALLRHDSVTDTRAFHRYARQRERGWSNHPTQEGGVGLQAEGKGPAPVEDSYAARKTVVRFEAAHSQA